ncbi:carbohydrate ABC transporter permease [Plantactinospora mayteni]|uniref:Lactose ABC transporter permease n=1 Tax=Plantactinospora mayteni TaxID=566021 RepID=A0ABQ4ERE8_9ACTN|nr:lactose ABC transporter permease [Plantactinospora mayteni]
MYRIRRTLRSLLTYVLLCAIAVLFMAPFALLLSTALKSSGQDVFGFPPQWIPRPPVLTWFGEAWSTIPFARYLLNSVIYEIGIIPAYLVVSALTAYPLAVMRFRGRTVLFYLFLATMFMPAEVLLIPRFMVVSQLGLNDTYVGVMLPAILSAIGIFLLRQTFAAVPRELLDAAAIDGCGHLRVLWHVMVPVARPTFAVLSILGFISVWNSFIWPLVVLNDTDKYPIVLGLAFLSGIAGNDVRGLAAGTIISIIPITVFFLLMQRHILDGMSGAVKG